MGLFSYKVKVDVAQHSASRPLKHEIDGMRERERFLEESAGPGVCEGYFFYRENFFKV
jgi:hypothetical protein